jgi:hypothetical protein
MPLFFLLSGGTIDTLSMLYIQGDFSIIGTWIGMLGEAEGGKRGKGDGTGGGGRGEATYT